MSTPTWRRVPRPISHSSYKNQLGKQRILQNEDHLDLSEYYYIPLYPRDKKPIRSWNGWPIDPNEEHVYDLEEAREQAKHWDCDWAIVGHRDRDLLVIDVDTYKFDDPEGIWAEITSSKLGDKIEQTTLVETGSGGKHIYFFWEGDTLPDFVNNVDKKGCAAKGYVKAPFAEQYELLNNTQPIPITESDLKDTPIYKESGSSKKRVPDPQEYEPAKPRQEVKEIAETPHLSDCYDALHYLDPADIPTLEASYQGTGTDDIENWDPAGYRETKSHCSLARLTDGPFFDREDLPTPSYFGVLDIFAAEQGIIDRPYDELSGEDFIEAYERAIDHGAPLPRYVDDTLPKPEHLKIADRPDPDGFLESSSYSFECNECKAIFVGKAGIRSHAVESTCQITPPHLTKDEVATRTGNSIKRSMSAAPSSLVPPQPACGG